MLHEWRIKQLTSTAVIQIGDRETSEG